MKILFKTISVIFIITILSVNILQAQTIIVKDATEAAFKAQFKEKKLNLKFKDDQKTIVNFLSADGEIVKYKQLNKIEGEYKYSFVKHVGEDKIKKLEVRQGKFKDTYSSSTKCNLNFTSDNKVNTEYNLEINWEFGVKNNKPKNPQIVSIMATKILSPNEKTKIKKDAIALITQYYGVDGIKKGKPNYVNVNDYKVKELKYIDNGAIEDYSFKVVGTPTGNTDKNGKIVLTVSRTMLNNDGVGNKLTQKFTIKNGKITSITLVSGNVEPVVVAVVEPVDDDVVIANPNNQLFETAGKQLVQNFTNTLNSYLSGGAKDINQKNELLDMFSSNNSVIEIKNKQGVSVNRSIDSYLSRLKGLSQGQTLYFKAKLNNDLKVDTQNNSANISFEQDFKNPNANYCDFTIKKVSLKKNNDNKVKIDKITVVNVSDCRN